MGESMTTAAPTLTDSERAVLPGIRATVEGILAGPGADVTDRLVAVVLANIRENAAAGLEQGYRAGFLDKQAKLGEALRKAREAGTLRLADVARDIALALQGNATTEAVEHVVSEVANGTGYTGKDRSTYADALALNAYQTGKTGAELHGFELKVSRADWLSEKADPGKAEAVRKFCDRWFLVVPWPAEAIVRAGELPEGWGLLEVSLGAVKVKTAAPALHAPKDRPALPRSFIAALVRRASEERGEREALKAALLKAPMRQVMHGDFWQGALLLTCGHVIRPEHRGRGIPKSVRCLPCADGLPPAVDVVREAMRAMNAVELRAFAADATLRAADVDRQADWYSTKGLGFTPQIQTATTATEDAPR